MKRLAACLLIGAALATGAAAQDYPVKPIRLVVPNPPGGSNDLVARLAGERLRARWGQPAVVENRAGASGRIGAEFVSHAAPDGYTFLVSSPAALVINKSLYAKLSYDSDAFVPVTVIASGTGVLVVHPGVAASTTRELIELARSQPGKLTYSSQGNGTIAHLAGELFDITNNIRTVHVPYKGSAPAVADLVAGQVNFLFSELATALPQIQAGKLRALAVGATRRHPLLPSVPLMADTNADFYFSYWTAMVAPAGTPLAIARRVSSEIAEGLKQPEMAKRFAEASLEPVGSSPEDTATYFKAEGERWGNVIRKTGLKGE